MRSKAKARPPRTEEDLVQEYFKCIDKKDLPGVMELFSHEATVQEPFSNIKGGLKGRSAIEPFVKVAMMANASLHRTIKIEKPARPNRLVALITFEKGDKVKGRFAYEFEDEPDGKRIRSLKIEFIG